MKGQNVQLPSRAHPLQSRRRTYLPMLRDTPYLPSSEWQWRSSVRVYLSFRANGSLQNE